MHEIAKFLSGFMRFQSEFFCQDNKLFGELREGQSPKALVIACSDSRVEPAHLTGSDPGDLFVVRNVANLVPPYEDQAKRQAGSPPTHHGVSSAVEYAVKHLKVEHIIVLGHGQCGGIMTLLNDEAVAQTEFIGPWVNIARAARDEVLAKMPDADAHEQQKACEQASILLSLENLLTFPWVWERVARRELYLHGWYFDMAKGELLGYLPQTGAFEPLVPKCAAETSAEAPEEAPAG
jgi:carbonic anhydrase